MPFITFLGHKKSKGIFALNGPVTIGRSLECDVYVPDVFVSRRHCRFEERGGQWYLIDQDSMNGAWCGGKRVDEYVLKPGDVIEIGSIAIVFNTGDAEEPSNPAPFGMGLSVTELMDTVCSDGVRPSTYSKQHSKRRQQWLERQQARLRAAEEAATMPHVEVEDLQPWNREDWAELDLESQIAAAQEAMTNWRAPIFNPTPELLSAMLGTDGLPSPGAVAASMAGGSVDADSVDSDSADEIDINELVAPSFPRKSIFAKLTGWIPFVGKKKQTVYDGIEIESYTWWDRLKEGLGEKIGGMRSSAKLNPQMAVVVALGLVAAVAATVKFAPSMVRTVTGASEYRQREMTPEEKRIADMP